MAFGRTIPTASSLLTGIVGYWKLDDATITDLSPIVDSTGTQNGAIHNTGAEVTSVAGNIGTALSFNSGSHYISFLDNAAHHVGDIWSYSFWVKRTRTGVTEELIGYNTNGIEILFYQPGAVPDGIQLAKSGVALIANSTASITDTNFHHVVVTKNGATTIIYIDGTAGTSAITNATISDPGTGWHAALTFGGSLPFVGTMDEIGFWNRAITSGEVTSLYNGGTGITYPF